eukprot:146634_1
MARQLSSVSNNLCDIRLLSKQEEKQDYMCGKCHNLAINTKALICSNHEQDTTLYCGSCATSILSDNQCPINQHQNPIFSDQHVVQARIKRNVEFICPYSAQLNRYHVANHGHIQDTLEGKPQDGAIRCHWKGTYTQLQHHVVNCTFKTRDCKSLIDLKKTVQTLQSDLNNKICAIEDSLSVLVDALSNKANRDEMKQSTDALMNELSNKVNRDEVERSMDVLLNELPKKK